MVLHCANASLCLELSANKGVRKRKVNLHSKQTENLADWCFILFCYLYSLLVKRLPSVMCTADASLSLLI